MNQKKYAIDYNAWMIWTTSKEYKITYHPNKNFKEFDLAPTMAEIDMSSSQNLITVNGKNYTQSNFHNNGFTEINLCNDITIVCELKGLYVHYYLVHYKADEDRALFSYKKIMEFPELKKSYAGCWCCERESFATNKDGTMVVSILKDGTIAKIVPKRIPSKNLLTFNVLYDASFNYL